MFFNVQHKQVKNINKKHWNLLHMDKILGPLLPSTPPIVFTNLVLKIAPTIKKPTMLLWSGMKGFYRYFMCLNCKITKFNRKTQVICSMVNDFKWKSKEFAHYLKKIKCWSAGVKKRKKS